MPQCSAPSRRPLSKLLKRVYFTTWPNSTRKLIKNRIPPSVTTAKGHMHQTRNNLKSTKPQEPKTPEEQPMKPLVQRTNTVFTKIIDHKRQISTDLSGKFPVT